LLLVVVEVPLMLLVLEEVREVQFTTVHINYYHPLLKLSLLEQEVMGV
jgi:hypothetical protein